MSTTKKLTRTAILLALMLVVQCFKNFSPYITGPIVNLILLVAFSFVDLKSSIALCVLAPVTSYLITQSPLITATNFAALPVIMIGNIIYVISVYIFSKENIFTSENLKLIFGLFFGCILKWVFMFLSSEWVLKTIFSKNLTGMLAKKIGVMFGSLQLIAGLIGAVLFFVIYKILKKADIK